MSENVERWLGELRRGGEDGPMSRLSALVVDDVLSRPVPEVLDADRLAADLHAGFSAAVHAPRSLERTVALVRAEIARIAAADTAGARLPPPVRALVPELAAREFTPDPALVRALIDREPLRGMLRALLVEALTDFGRRLRTAGTDNALVKGIGGLGKLAGDAARSRLGGIGALAGTVVGAVSDEVERQLERRVQEFADIALENMLSRIVEQVGNPRAARDQSALRKAIAEAALGLPGTAVAKDAERAKPEEIAQRIIRSLAEWADSEDAAREFRARVAEFLEPYRSKSLGDALEEHALRDPVARPLRRWVSERLEDFVRGAAFEEWLRSVDRDSAGRG